MFSSELGGTFIPDQPTRRRWPASASRSSTWTRPSTTATAGSSSKGFTPRMIAELVEEIERRAAAVVDDVCERGEAEFVEEIAAQVPVQMICEMIGLEHELWPRMFEISNLLIGSRDDPDYQELPGGPEAAAMEVYMLCDAVAADRRANPRDDIMTALVQAEIDGERLDRRRAQPLLHHPDRRRQRDDAEPDQPLDAGPHRPPRPGPAPARRPVAVGHRRRGDAPLGQLDPQLPPHRHHATPSCAACRSRPATRSSCTTPRPTATRTCSTIPTRFDVGRTPNDHVTFGGGGVHFCLGASLARAEIKATMRQVVERLPDLELAGEPDRLHSDFVNGIKTMPVRFTPTHPTHRHRST